MSQAQKIDPDRLVEIRVKTANNCFGPEWAERALLDLMAHIKALEADLSGRKEDQLPTSVPFSTD